MGLCQQSSGLPLPWLVPGMCSGSLGEEPCFLPVCRLKRLQGKGFCGPAPGAGSQAARGACASTPVFRSGFSCTYGFNHGTFLHLHREYPHASERCWKEKRLTGLINWLLVYQAQCRTRRSLLQPLLI